MDVLPGNGTGQQWEGDDSDTETLTVMTAAVNSAVSLHNNRNSEKGGCDGEKDKEDSVPSSIVLPSQSEGGKLLEDSRLLVDEGSNSSASGVETFNGKIVCNSDGSAYLIEGVDSELSDWEYGDLDLFPFKKSNVLATSRLGASQNPGDNQAPQVVSALHIARYTAFPRAVCGQSYDNLLRENKRIVPEILVTDSYRVFTLKDRTGEYVTRLTSSDSKVTSNLDTLSYSVSDCGTVPVKHILMCFICKLSFGFMKSFIAHATGEHSLSLNDTEKELVSRKNISSIIQGVTVKPLLSFLEPIPPNSAVTNSSCSQKVGTGNIVSGGSANFVASVISSLHGSVSSSSSYVVRTKEDLVASIAATPAAVTSVVSTSICQVTSVPNLGAAPVNEAEISSSTLNPCTSTFGDKSLVLELENVANIEKLSQSAAAAADVVPVPQSSTSSPSFSPDTNFILDTSAASNSINQSNADSMPNLLSPTAKTAFNVNHHYQQKTSPIPNSNLGIPDDSIDYIFPKSSASHSSTNQSSAPIAADTTSISISACTPHPEDKVKDVEFPICNRVLDSSKSLSRHITLVHSSKTCKTLMCPKCNNYFKCQKALEVHMKQIHTENRMTCMYCATNQPHPQPAPGENYTCGYKPYRCEVCNFSTKTKKHLNGHMQSVKHINKVQEFQTSSLTPENIVALQQQSQHTQNSRSPSAASLGVSLSNAALETLKNIQLSAVQKANYRCDVCNYETNVALYLRIHLTSEKHTHNMMVLQQNMKLMQHMSTMQQAQAMDPVFHFHPGLLMTDNAQLQPEAAISDMTYNPALPMVTSQQQQQQKTLAAAAAKQVHMTSIPLNLSCSTPAIDLDDPDPTLRPYIPYEDSYKLFQCCVCTIFSSNLLEQLVQHVELDRSRLREEEVLTEVEGTSICELCTYKTNLKSKLKLHCETDIHLQRLHNMNHVKEGGPRNNWKLKYVKGSKPVQVRCNSCEYYSNTLHDLKLHVTNSIHEVNGRLFLFLERSESVVRTELKTYHCTMCSVSVRTKVNLIQHANSFAHLSNENLRQMQGESEPAMGDVIFVVKECKPASPESIKCVDEERENKFGDAAGKTLLSNEEKFKEDKKMFKNSDSFILKQALLDRSAQDAHETQQHTCPFCNFSSISNVCIQMHVVSQHSQNPATLACPLCQDAFREWDALENHVMDTHHVKKESMNNIMTLLDKTELHVAQSNSSNSKQSMECKTQNNAESPKVVTDGPATLNSCNPLDLSTKKYNNLDLVDSVEVKQVLHQSKAARVQDFALSGPLDLRVPLVERPNSIPPVEQHQVKYVETTISTTEISSSKATTIATQNSKPPEIQAFSVSNSSTTKSTTASIPSINSTSQFPFPLHPDHNKIMQQALGLVPHDSLMQSQASPFACNRCGFMCSSQEVLMQHQQLYCFYSQSQLLPLLNSQISVSQTRINPSLSYAQRHQLDRDEPPENKDLTSLKHPEKSSSPVIQINHPSNQRSPTPGQQMFKSGLPFLRPKTSIFRHLLEESGFNVAMQFNENSQRRPKEEDKVENNSLKNEQTDKESQKKKIDFPEMNRYTCNKCGQVFSSIWVFKAHQEEIHKDVVPIKVLEKFAKEYRVDYELRNVSASVVDGATNMTEVPSSSSRGELADVEGAPKVTPSGATPLLVQNAATPPATSLGSQMPDVASSVTASNMAQKQFNQIMSMGIGMGLSIPMNMGMHMNLPFAAAMNMHPPIIPSMVPPPIDTPMAYALGHRMMLRTAVDPKYLAAQQSLPQQQQQQSQQKKRVQTRINDDQLKILRGYFDIKKSPTEDQILEMSEKSGLPLKVIKYWFRNTLFKERQKTKD